MNGNCAIQIEIELEHNYQKTIPSCKDCVATIVTTRIPRTRKGIGTTCPAFREEIRLLFARFQNPEGSRDKTVTLCFYELLASGHVLN